MSDPAVWEWIGDEADRLLLFLAVCVELLLIWAHQGDRHPDPWAPTHCVVEPADDGEDLDLAA